MEDSPGRLGAEKHLHSPVAPQPAGAACPGRATVGRAVSPAAALWDPVGRHCPPRQLPLLGIPAWLPREAGAE